MLKDVLKDMVIQNQFTSSFSFNRITNENISHRLNENTASIGFIYRHIGELMNMFGGFFDVHTDVKNTTMGQTDIGQGNNLEETKSLVEKGYAMLQKLVETTPDDVWMQPVNTPFFGTVSKARLFGHVLFHTSHHAGQIALTLNRGKMMDN